MKLSDWGRAYIINVSLDVLKEYRGAAKSAPPELRELEVEWRGKTEHKKLAEVIAVIEIDTNPPKLISLRDYLGNDEPTKTSAPK